MNPNFVLHMLWSKTSLNNQQPLLDLFWILIHAFMTKNKHKLGNNSSSRDKIMVNSPKVHFGIR
jgi:hypothetical protein